MQLENVYAHKRNSRVTVNGNQYWIGPGGFIADEKGDPADVLDEDAAKLLQGKAWKKLSWDPTAPENKARFTKASDYPKGKGIGRPPRSMEQMGVDYLGKPIKREDIGPQAVGTATKDGQLEGVEAVPPSDEELAKATQEDQDNENEDAEKHGRDSAAQFAAEAGQPPGKEPTIIDPPAPGEGEDWPDPTEGMSTDYLKQMAAAYEVKFAKNIGKKTLLKRIMKEMYPEE